MFREMRRAKQQLGAEECCEILQKCENGVLAVSGDDGYPYTVPLNYAWSDGKIYCHCAKSGHKIDAINRNDKVSFCVIEQDDVVTQKLTTFYRSVIVFGRARILEDEDEIRRVTRNFTLKFNDDENFIKEETDRFIKSLACVEITPDHITGKEAIELTKQRENN